jgi:hypothetical protein
MITFHPVLKLADSVFEVVKNGVAYKKVVRFLSCQDKGE